MKNLKTIFFSLCLISSVLGLTSCDNDDDEKTAVYLPSKIKFEQNDLAFTPQTNKTSLRGIEESESYPSGTLEYTYDNQNRIISEVYISQPNYSGDAMVIETKFVYNKNKLSEVIINSPNVSDTLVLTQEGLVITAKYKTNSEYECKITVNSSGLPLTVEYPGLVTSDFEYDSSGNLLSVKQTIKENDNDNYNYNNIEPIHSTYKYDKENGIFKNVKSPAWTFLFLNSFEAQYSRVNNFVEINTTDYPKYTATYEYNKDGYPTKYNITDEIATNRIYSREIEYIKK